jgi:bifunctional non-homologous end joining protein LigD
MPDVAPGIPASKSKGKLPSIKRDPKDWEFVLHDHQAERAGHHFDLRLSDGKKAFSWAVPKGLPEPGQKRLAIRQPDHRPSYMPFEGVIEKGYGKGTVQVADKGNVKVTKSTEDKIQFVLMDKRDAEEFTMVRTKGDNWLLMNHTPTRDSVDKELLKKPKYKAAPTNQVASFFSHQWALQPKIDGGHGVTEIMPHRTRVYSVRPSVRSNRVLQYTHKIPGLEKVKSPKGKTVVRGEVYAEGSDGKVIPAAALGGILNSTPTNALRRLMMDRITMKQALFDVEMHNGRNVKDLPYVQKLPILKEIASKNPDVFRVAETATSVKEKADLFQAVSDGEHPLTTEGVVAHNLVDPSQKPVKLVLVEDHDVFVRKVVPAKKGTKYDQSHAGGFEYSHTPRGRIAGRVGTGLSDDLRREMHLEPEKFVGRSARVLAKGKGEGGALRAPSFRDWHLDKSALDKEAALLGFFATLVEARNHS